MKRYALNHLHQSYLTKSREDSRPCVSLLIPVIINASVIHFDWICLWNSEQFESVSRIKTCLKIVLMHTHILCSVYIMFSSVKARLIISERVVVVLQLLSVKGHHIRSSVWFCTGIALPFYPGWQWKLTPQWLGRFPPASGDPNHTRKSQLNNKILPLWLL